jgi:two-component system, OmpR family, sensor histidine kinase SenX3
VDSTTQALLFALLGAVLGAGVVLAWRVSEHRMHQGIPDLEPAVPPGIATVLSVLRSSALVVNENDEVLRASAAAYSFGLVRGNQVAVQELADLVRQVRRDGQIRETELVAAATRTRRSTHLTARVAPLSSRLVLALVEDRTRERRVEAIRRDFVANVSHELKTPVGALTLLAEAVQDAAGDPATVARFASRMQHEGARLARLVGELMELSRVQGMDPMPGAASVDVRGLLDESADRSRLAAEQAGIEIVVSCEQGLVVRGNEAQLATAVANLVDNAIAYSPHGTRVVVSARASSDHQARPTVDIAVTDQGLGIEQADIDRIFERFYRVDPARSRATGGTGLGLAIVKNIVTNHLGTVAVQSAVGSGSTFTIRLPRVHSDARPSSSDEAGPLTMVKGPL